MDKIKKRKSRHFRVRKKVSGDANSLRLSVFRSNKYIYAQLIDDDDRKTLIAFSDFKNGAKVEKVSKLEIAFQVGKKIADLAKKKKIQKVVFDRGGYKYHGRVKSLAQGAREGGLTF